MHRLHSHVHTDAPRAAAQLTASDVHVAFDRPVLAGVDLTLSAGTRLGVVGENGAGKSTLLRVIAGELAADSGSLRVAGRVALVGQEIEVADRQTVGDLIDLELAETRAALRELDLATEGLVAGARGAEARYADALAVAETIDAWDADRRVGVALAAMGAPEDRSRPLAELSVGQRHRVRLACVLGAGHGIVLLDEPTNHLDRDGLAFLTSSLRAHEGISVLVTHDRALLADVATSVLDLDPTSDGRPRLYGTGYAEFTVQRNAERDRWAAEYAAQVERAARLERDLESARSRLVSGWRPPKGTDAHARATRAPSIVRTVHRRAEELAENAVTIPEPPLQLGFPDLPRNGGRTLVWAGEVEVAGRLAATPEVELRSGGRLLVTGENGAGKSTLLSVLAGRHLPTGGRVERARDVRVCLLAQESTETGSASARRIYERIVGRLVSAGTLAEADVVPLGSLGLLDRADLGRPIRELSVGQRRRLELACLLAARPHVLLLDEPTNHLSMALVDELTEAMRTTRAAVVVASHDRQLLRDVADWPHLELQVGHSVAA